MKITRKQLQNLIKKSLLSESTYVDEEGNLRDASSGVIIEPGTAGLSGKSKKGTQRFDDSEVLARDRRIQAAQAEEFSEDFGKNAEIFGNLLLVGGGIAASFLNAPLTAAVLIGILGGATTARDATKKIIKAFAKPGGKVKLEQISDEFAKAYGLDDEILEVLNPGLVDQTIDIFEREIVDPAREQQKKAYEIITLRDFLKKQLREKSLGQVVITSK